MVNRGRPQPTAQRGFPSQKGPDGQLEAALFIRVERFIGVDDRPGIGRLQVVDQRRDGQARGLYTRLSPIFGLAFAMAFRSFNRVTAPNVPSSR